MLATPPRHEPSSEREAVNEQPGLALAGEPDSLDADQ